MQRRTSCNWSIKCRLHWETMLLRLICLAIMRIAAWSPVFALEYFENEKSESLGRNPLNKSESLYKKYASCIISSFYQMTIIVYLDNCFDLYCAIWAAHVYNLSVIFIKSIIEGYSQNADIPDSKLTQFEEVSVFV